MRVWLVGTVHKEKGRATATRLLEILDRLRPDVMFLEVPAAALDTFLDGSLRSLESEAATRYSESRKVVLVPSDLPTPEASFFRDSEYLFGQVERTSPDYRRLIDQHRRNVALLGFPYLNSARCSRLWSDVYQAVRAAVARLDDRRMTELYESWQGINARRDEAMVTAVELYSGREVFGDAVLLVGAAHRKSILERAERRRAAGAMNVEWAVPEFAELSG